MTLYQEHVKRWENCTACHLCKTRDNVVLARGTVPCVVLFVGEAPGASENVLGIPFVGPAGQLLDRIISEAVPSGVSYALTNLVCCIPREDDGTKTAKPDDKSIKACSVRLEEFIEIASPRLIVNVGDLARDWLTPGFKYSIKIHVHGVVGQAKIPQVHITHPAAILRNNIAMRGLAVRRCVVTIANAIADL